MPNLLLSIYFTGRSGNTQSRQWSPSLCPAPDLPSINTEKPNSFRDAWKFHRLITERNQSPHTKNNAPWRILQRSLAAVIKAVSPLKKKLWLKCWSFVDHEMQKTFSSMLKYIWSMDSCYFPLNKHLKMIGPIISSLFYLNRHLKILRLFYGF